MGLLTGKKNHVDHSIFLNGHLYYHHLSLSALGHRQSCSRLRGTLIILTLHIHSCGVFQTMKVTRVNHYSFPLLRSNEDPVLVGSPGLRRSPRLL